MRKDAEKLLKYIVDKSKRYNDTAVDINISEIKDIPNIRDAKYELLFELDQIGVIRGFKEDVLGETYVYLTTDGQEYFDENRKENLENKNSFTINMNGGQVNIAKDSGYVSASNENIIYDKSIENPKRQDIDQVTNNERKRYLKTNGSKNISIFISYSWSDAEFVNEIDNKLQAYNYKIERDIRDAEYAQNIKEFMKKIRKTDYSIIILSDDFLKSENCMREIFEFIKDENFKDRIIPVILQSAKDIWGSSKGIQYTIYWKEKEDKFKEQLKKIDEESKGGYIEELKHISSIKNSIGEIIKIFRDMKMFDANEGDLAENINSYIKKKKKPKTCY